MLALRSVLYALLIPGTVTVVIPLWLAVPRLGTALNTIGPLQSAGLLPIVCGAAILIRCIWDFAVVGRGTLAPMDSRPGTLRPPRDFRPAPARRERP